nr:hypothetical protein [Tanacetum cinerariifolium]
MAQINTWRDTMEKVKKRLSNWKMNILSIGGRLTLVKSVLGSMPLYQFSLFKVPMGVLNYIETLRSRFLNGCANNNKKAIWMNWKNALVPKDIGGLGGYGSCWTNIVQEFYSLVDKGVNVFQYLRLQVGNGEDTKFWEDRWFEGACSRTNFIACMRWKRVKISLLEVSLNSNADRWSWLLDKSGVFAVSSVRNLIDEKILPKTEFQTRWNKCVPIKINVHTWKIMTNSLPTRFNISRRGILIDSIKCPICDQGVETSSHLFFTCLMVRRVFNMINRWWSLHSVEVDSYEGWLLWIDNVHIPVKNKSLLEGVFQVTWWLLWYFRNKTIFEAKVPRKALFFDEVVCKSYHWCRYRCKSCFSWVDWLKSPNLIKL